MSSLSVYKDRRNDVEVNLGVDVSGDTIISQIRAGKSKTSALILEWEVSFVTDGADGKLLFTIDDSEVSSETITQKRGYMDIVRIAGGQPYPVLKYPIRVNFRDSVTEVPPE